MRKDPEGVVDAALVAYAIGDLDAHTSFFAEDIVFAIYIGEDIFPFAGEWKGRAKLREILQTIVAEFELEQYEPRNISSRDNVVRCQAAFTYRHRQSGEVIDGIERIVAQVDDGLITRYREYHDVDRIRAFMRLCSRPVSPAGPCASADTKSEEKAT